MSRTNAVSEGMGVSSKIHLHTKVRLETVPKARHELYLGFIDPMEEIGSTNSQKSTDYSKSGPRYMRLSETWQVKRHPRDGKAKSPFSVVAHLHIFLPV